jgi:ABC transport system ATP-binding/permease protein
VSHDRDFLDRVVTATLVAEGEGRWVEYAGGYTDMVRQRGAGVGAMVTKETRPAGRKAAAIAKPAASKRKLSFNERHDLGTLPSRIADLQSLIADLQSALGDAGLYKRDPALFEKTSAALASAQSDLSSAENRWLALEMLREELEP